MGWGEVVTEVGWGGVRLSLEMGWDGVRLLLRWGAVGVGWGEAVTGGGVGRGWVG